MAPVREGRKQCRSALLTLAAFCLAGLASLPVCAQQQQGAVYGRNAEDQTDTRVTLTVKDQPLEDVIKHIQEASGVNLILAEGIDEKVTLNLVQVEWRIALEIAAEAAGCTLVEKSSNVIKITQPQPVTFNFTGADIKTVIDAIAKVSGASIVTAPNVEGSVHLRITNVPWRTALDTVVKTLGYVVVEDGYNIFRVVHPSSLQEQMITRVFQVKYLRPPPRYTPNIRTEYAEGRAAANTNFDPEKDFTLITALRGALSPNGTLNYFVRNNTVVVKDIPPVVAEIERMLAEIDVEPAAGVHRREVRDDRQHRRPGVRFRHR